MRAEVLRHAAAEEQYEHPRLRENTRAQRLAVMAKTVRAAEAMAPTRPRPGVATAAQNLAVGPMGAVVDRVRDAVREVMGGSEI
ncbi:hypothetical protein ACIBBD_03535 [Streptomyces sp. NPDC051315]|uniref:hypothetical protein n=1 Tax=Streptomyces sp. NPDC051315 TaxID=3365650 RepID=UPI0037A695E9